MNLTPERLIVAADFKPDPKKKQDWRWAEQKVLNLAYALKGTGVYLKVNSVLRASEYDLIYHIHAYDLKVFADLKLYDIPETLATDGIFLRKAGPELLTVSCAAGVSALRAVKAELPDVEVLGVTVLTSLTEADSERMFRCSVEEAVLNFASTAEEAGLDGLISSAKEVRKLRDVYGDRFSLNTPAIRPKWSIVANDDQNKARIMTPEMAIKAGADRLVIGRPITQADNPREAVLRTLEEIEEAGVTF
jgi:orotidine-5'-phosphate decarboxylase